MKANEFTLGHDNNNQQKKLLGVEILKTGKARLNSGDDWKTPDDFYKKLDAIYHFDFDPCPYQADFDGLKISWGKRNFVNPPYSRKLKEAFVRKAVKESCVSFSYLYQLQQNYSMM